MDHKEEFFLPEEAVEWIGLKKSELLSQLIENSPVGDFGFEEIQQFDHLIPSTIQEPDRAYLKNNEDYQLRTYVRTYQQMEQFHQVVIGGVFPDKNGQEEVFVPILIFISRKEEVVQIFAVGENLVRQVLN